MISHGFTFNGRFDDTRAYDFDRERWTELAPGRSPTGRALPPRLLPRRQRPARPVRRAGQRARARSATCGSIGDGAWTRLSDPPPAARRLYALAEAGPDAWIFGGAGRDDRVLDDLWRVDRETLAFERVRPDGPRPPAGPAAVMVADPTRRRLLLFGGEGPAPRSTTSGS